MKHSVKFTFDICWYMSDTLCTCCSIFSFYRILGFHYEDMFYSSIIKRKMHIFF